MGIYIFPPFFREKWLASLLKPLTYGWIMGSHPFCFDPCPLWQVAPHIAVSGASSRASCRLHEVRVFVFWLLHSLNLRWSHWALLSGVQSLRVLFLPLFTPALSYPLGCSHITLIKVKNTASFFSSSSFVIFCLFFDQDCSWNPTPLHLRGGAIYYFWNLWLFDGFRLNWE